MNVATETRQLAAMVNETLAEVDELREAVRHVNAKREQLRARIVKSLPYVFGETDFGRQARIIRLQTSLDALLRPLSGFELKAGRELRDSEVERAAAEITSLVKEK